MCANQGEKRTSEGQNQRKLHTVLFLASKLNTMLKKMGGSYM